jgi:6-phosphogluconolactonase/glucosamine-6-phosphate isomerase/deaminase
MKIIKVENSEEGIEICKKLLYEMVSKNSVLFLSGGSTPKVLYQKLAEERKLKVGAVALVDERFGEKLHENSNEKIIQDTGLIQYFEQEKTRFYPILENESIQKTANNYDETLRYLFNYFPKSVGVLGVGVDGHTAGIPAIEKLSQIILDDKSSLVNFYEDEESFYKQRITLTFLGLSKLDQIIVLVFGKEKRKALSLMFKLGSITQIPCRFLAQPEMSDKVTLITDQSV